jgi:hypothetical protein
MNANFYSPKRLVYGAGSSSALGSLLVDAGCDIGRVQLVSDRFIEGLGLL